MDNEKIICPICKKECVAEKCAWYLPEDMNCSIKIIAISLNEIAVLVENDYIEE